MLTPLTNSQVEVALTELPAWRFEQDKLSKSFQLKNFSAALAFMVRIGIEAEKANHHPELFNCYNKVSLSLCTHDAGGKVTQKDLALAIAIEQLIATP